METEAKATEKPVATDASILASIRPLLGWSRRNLRHNANQRNQELQRSKELDLIMPVPLV